jgi:MSHA biogenesis protein MshL
MRQQIQRFIQCGVIAFLLASCTTAGRHEDTGIDSIQAALQAGVADNQKLKTGNQPPAAVRAALLPSLAQLPAVAPAAEQRFNVSVSNAPAKSFLMGLVAGTKYNMVVSPDVSGVISLNLKNVTVPEVLDAVRDMYGYDYRATAYGFEVSPHELQTQVFTVNYLDMQRTGHSQTQVESSEISQVVGSSSSGSSSTPTTPSNTNSAAAALINTNSKADFWGDLQKTLTGLVGAEKGRSVVVNPQAGIVVVRAYPEELRAVADYLDDAQNNLDRQVVIEAKVLEVRLKKTFQAGINWKVLGLRQVGASTATLSGAEPQAFTPMFMSSGNANNVINLLETQGNVQVLSSPHISTTNNQPALIKVGGDNFFVTSFSTTVVPTTGGASTQQNVGLTPFFSGITLDVTPQISSNGEIILHVHPLVSAVVDQSKTITAGGNDNKIVLPLAASTIRESDSIVRAQSGQMIIIGGLMQNETTEKLASVPGVSRIPFFGALFRDTDQLSNRSELVILLQAFVPNNKTQIQSIQQASGRIQELNRGFHVGSLPEVFGTEGETGR